jgi:hypothetical protein
MPVQAVVEAAMAWHEDSVRFSLEHLESVLDAACAALAELRRETQP